MWAVSQACGGVHYDIGGDTGTATDRFAPLQYIDTDSDFSLGFICFQPALNYKQKTADLLTTPGNLQKPWLLSVI